MTGAATSSTASQTVDGSSGQDTRAWRIGFDLLAWGFFGPETSWGFGLISALAVLIIACSWALGLATPMSMSMSMSIMVAIGKARPVASCYTQARPLGQQRDISARVAARKRMFEGTILRFVHVDHHPLKDRHAPLASRPSAGSSLGVKAFHAHSSLECRGGLAGLQAHTSLDKTRACISARSALR